MWMREANQTAVRESVENRGGFPLLQTLALVTQKMQKHIKEKGRIKKA